MPASSKKHSGGSTVEPVAEGARVVCAAHFKLRFPYLVLAPVFYGMSRAIRSDLENLKRILEA